MPSLWSQSTQGQSHVVSAMSYTGSWQRDQMWQKVSLLGNPDTLTKRLLKWNHLPNVGRGPVVADKEVFEVALVVRSRGGRLCLRYHDDEFDYDWANDGNDDDCDDCDVDDIDDDCDDTHGKPPILELRPSAPHVGCVLEMVICIVVCVQSDVLYVRTFELLVISNKNILILPPLCNHFDTSSRHDSCLFSCLYSMNCLSCCLYSMSIIHLPDQLGVVTNAAAALIARTDPTICYSYPVIITYIHNTDG